MEQRIRPAAVADATSLAQVRIDTWRTSYRGIIPEHAIAGMDIAKETARWVDRLNAAQPGIFMFAVEIKEFNGDGVPHVVGFCGGGPNRDADPEYSGEVYAIYVLQAYQGKGLGRTLMQAAVERLRKDGHGSMLIWVLRDNLPARGFYEALGGKAVRERSIEIGGVSLPEVGYGYDLTHWVV